jgi:predicted nucleotidyltransferase
MIKLHKDIPITRVQLNEIVKDVRKLYPEAVGVSIVGTYARTGEEVSRARSHDVDILVRFPEDADRTIIEARNDEWLWNKWREDKVGVTIDFLMRFGEKEPRYGQHVWRMEQGLPRPEIRIWGIGENIVKTIRDILLERIFSHGEAIAFIQGFDNTFPSTATIDDVNRYRRKLAFKFHPDLGHSDVEIKDINNALDVIEKTIKGGGAYFKPFPSQTKTAYKPYSGENVWRWAGWSGGSPPSDSIPPGLNINYIKKKAWEKSGANPNPTKDDEFTFWNFDGRYSRGVFTIFSKKDMALLKEIASLMVEWDSYFESKAVAVTGKQIGHKKCLIFPVKKGSVSKKPFELEHDSFNLNPFNDNDFILVLNRRLGGKMESKEERRETFRRFYRA